MSNGLRRFIPRNRSNERGYPPHVSMGRIAERMERVHRDRVMLEREFDRDIRRTPIWQWLRGGTQEDFRKLYGALRSMGMEVSFDLDRSRHTPEPPHEGFLVELRYGHRIWAHRFSPMVIERSEDAQSYMIETVVTGAQQLFIEVALDNVLDDDHSVMPTRRPIGGNALRYAANTRLEFGPRRTDRPGVRITERPAPPPRVPPPDTNELRRNRRADLDHLNVANDLLGDPVERSLGPTPEALRESFRV